MVEVSKDKRVWNADGKAAVFCRARDPFGGLGNMAGGFGFTDPETGLRWSSSEAWYQAQRFPHLPEVQEEIRLASNGFMAKKVAHDHVRDSRKDWLDVNVAMMMRALELKAQNPRFVQELLSTGDCDIVEYSARDEFWGAKPRQDKTLFGANILGQLLMQLRARLAPSRDVRDVGF